MQGAQSYVVDACGNDIQGYSQLPAARACPIGVICIDKGHTPSSVESGSLCEYYDTREGDANLCWVDGFVAGWEETEHDKGWYPEGHSYTPEENPDGLEVYKRGYANGQSIRQDFIKLKLRIT